MDELLRDFVTETVEGLQQLDELILSLEANPENMGSIRDAFRILHTIKGTCGFIGLVRMQSVAHKAENILSEMREGNLTATPAIISNIFSALDTIRVICDGIEETGSEPENDDSELLKILDACLIKVETSTEDAPIEIEAVAPEAVVAPGDESPAEREPTLEELDAIFAQTECLDLMEAPHGSSQASEPAIEEHKEEPKKAHKELAEESHGAADEAPAPIRQPRAAAPVDEGASAKKEVAGANQSIRIGLDIVDDLMNLVGELVLTRNQLLQQDAESPQGNNFRNNVLSRLSMLTTELQQVVMKTRMQPVSNAWAKLPRLVRDTASELKKNIQLKQFGAETELDRQVIEFIKDPLVHMIRNSCDHGIETPEERKKAGKSEMGTISLKSFHQGGHVIIEITDDGKGIDPDQVKRKAIEKNVISEAEARDMSEDQLLQLIFEPGFSTAQAVTEISGRGVGMDIVLSNIENLSGAIKLSSQKGAGSTFTIKIPLTLSIISVLLVGCDDFVFALPQLSIIEILNVKGSRSQNIEHIEDKLFLRWRSKILPLIDLGDIMNMKSGRKEKHGEYIIVVQVLNNYFGLMVDKVYDSQEIVVKPLAKILKNIPLFSGSTILGNGEVVLIMDLNYFSVTNDKSKGLSFDITQDDIDGDKNKQTIILIFKSQNKLKAVPLALVSRIDEIHTSEVQDVQGQSIFLYREQLIPIMDYVDDPNRTEEAFPILMFSDRGYKIALVIDEVVDIIEASTEIQLDSNTEDDLGTAIIQGVPMTVIDSQSYFKKAYPHWHERIGDGGQKRGRRLLLVDDSKFFLNLITPLLRVSGFKVKTASSVDQAMLICHEAKIPFDIIISDLDMPDKDGYDFVEELKSSELLSSIPVVALSGNYSDKDIENTKKAGFIEFIPKTDQQALLRVLNQLP